jgi:very-short-patch-repair endonuclease
MSYPVILYPQLISRFRQKYSPPAVDVDNRGELLQAYLQQLRELLQGRIIQPDGVSDAPLGASEMAFGEVLKEYFGDCTKHAIRAARIQSQLKFPIPNSDNSYSVDFALTFGEIGINLDIEIDEPFNIKNGRATHSINHYHDRYRNTFFLNGNWIIVRFAEEQVVRYPKSCCKELATVIALTTGLRQYLKILESEPTLPTVEQWTKRQARSMSQEKYRSRYLP